MTLEEKKELIFKEWKKKIKGKKNTSAYWDVNHHSFTKWSIKKVRSEKSRLVQITKGDDWSHTNLKWEEIGRVRTSKTNK